MNNSSEIIYIRKCIALVEAQLNWGDSQGWSSYDFEKLGEAVCERTGVSLSITTLKRLWGKLKYDNIPTITTLNTLAQFAGYADWRDFKQQSRGDLLAGQGGAGTGSVIGEGDLSAHDSASGGTNVHDPGKVGGYSLSNNTNVHDPGQSGQHAPSADTHPHGQPASQRQRRWLYWLATPLLLIPLIYLLAYRPQKPAPPGAYAFSSDRMVATGVPNSVVFHYNARPAGDLPVYISQSWDTSRKVKVPAHLDTYSSIYYLPGYFRAKLIAGNEIVKEHDVMIASDGWLAAVERQQGIPVYFKQPEFDHGDSLGVDEQLMRAYNIDMQPELPALRFFNVRDMGRLQTDNFSFETTLKSPYSAGAAACQGVQVMILCKNDVIAIPLCAKGCTGKLTLFAAGVYVESANTDLSGFGCNLNEWVNLRVVTKQKQIRFWVNNREAYTLTFSNAASDIVGVQFRFSGTGAIRQTSFTGPDGVIRL